MPGNFNGAIHYQLNYFRLSDRIHELDHMRKNKHLSIYDLTKYVKLSYRLHALA